VRKTRIDPLQERVAPPQQSSAREILSATIVGGGTVKFSHVTLEAYCAALRQNVKQVLRTIFFQQKRRAAREKIFAATSRP
jgi:hypothetical protein